LQTIELGLLFLSFTRRRTRSIFSVFCQKSPVFDRLALFKSWCIQEQEGHGRRELQRDAGHLYGKART